MKWRSGKQYRQLRGSLLGPFGGRIYQTLVRLDVHVPGIKWPWHERYYVQSAGVRLDRSGNLLVARGYRYDGPSGPTWDDSTNMRAACAHDALYQLLRTNWLGLCGGKVWRHNRRVADELLGQLMIEDGAYCWRAAYYTWAVSHFGRGAAGA